jgi:hypothetical protein|tara:strand:+ start:33450 stop:33719 length:270 start_codon:yes stop_codon:yes gene_type:complete
MLKADGLDEAVIGKTYDVAVQEFRLVYSVNKCIKVLMDRDGMSDVEAREYLEHNTLCAYVDKSQPIFVDAEYFDCIEDLYDECEGMCGV